MAEGTEAECALAGDPASPRLRKPRGHAYLCLLDCPQQPMTRRLGTPDAPAAEQVNKWWDGHRAEHHLMRMDDTAPWSGSREPRIEHKKRCGATPWLRVRQPRDGEDSSVVRRRCRHHSRGQEAPGSHRAPALSRGGVWFVDIPCAALSGCVPTWVCGTNVRGPLRSRQQSGCSVPSE